MLSDTDRFARRAAVVALVGGPLVTLAGMLATPGEKEATTASYHDALAAHPDQAQVAAILLHLGYLLLLPAALAMFHLARRATPRLTHVGGVLALIGLGSLPGLLVTDFYDLALAQGLPRSQSVAISDSVGGAGMVALAIPAIGGTGLGLTPPRVATWRAGIARGWVPFAIFLGWFAPLASGTGLLPAAAGATLLV